MARTAEQVLRELLAAQLIQIAQQIAEIERLTEELAAAKIAPNKT